MDGRKPLRSYDIRERNEKLVLHLIYSRPGISQSEIAALTGLKPPTVFRIFTLLEGRGLIHGSEGESATAEKRGRRPSPYSVVPTALYAIGLDFWARTAAVAVFNFAGETVHRRTMRLGSSLTADGVASKLIGLIDGAIAGAGVPPEKLLGIGIGAPGVVDIEKGVVVAYERIRGMSDFGVKARLEEHFHVPVEVHNNCSVIALGAHRYGSARGEKSLVVFLIRSGLGGAFIHNGRLYVNQQKTAFEIGRFVLGGPGGRIGKTEEGPRKLEDSVSEDSILGAASRASPVRSWEELERKLGTEDPVVMKALARTGEVFSIQAQNVAQLLNPEAIMIVSRFKNLSTYFTRCLTRHIDRDSVRINLAKILPEEYDPLLACQGAADLILDTFFGIQH